MTNVRLNDLEIMKWRVEDLLLRSFSLHASLRNSPEDAGRLVQEALARLPIDVLGVGERSSDGYRQITWRCRDGGERLKYEFTDAPVFDVVDRGSLAAELMELPGGRVDLVVVHPLNFPQAMLLEVLEAADELGLSSHDHASNVRHRSGGLDWIIPAAVEFLLSQSIWTEITKLAVKDAYSTFKKTVSSTASFVLSRISRGHNRSSAFAVETLSQEGHRIKFLFPEGKPATAYDAMVDELFTLLGDRHMEAGSERLSALMKEAGGRSSVVYLERDPANRSWIRIDFEAEEEKAVATYKELKARRKT